MADEENPFLLPPPAPPDRSTALRVILLLSAAVHVVLLALFWRAPAEPAPRPSAGETVRVLRGQVTGDTGEPGLRLTGYAEVPAPKR
jgi:hypothetical protein